jgi:hypothetical protein
MNLTIVVDDGSVRVPIQNALGDEIGVFYFRPTDIGLIDRYNQMVGRFYEVTAPLEKISLNAEGEAAETATEEEIQALHESEQRLYDLLNEMFNANMAEAFFGQMHPFSPVGGRFYCENAIEAVGAFISKQFETETEKMSRKVSKYTKGYQKGSKK